MSERDSRTSEPRKCKWRFGPLRLALPWISVAAGIVMVIKGASGSSDPSFMALGFGLILLGVIAFFVYRAMAKRGL
jgi:hypothetical protein